MFTLPKKIKNKQYNQNISTATCSVGKALNMHYDKIWVSQWISVLQLTDHATILTENISLQFVLLKFKQNVCKWHKAFSLSSFLLVLSFCWAIQEPLSLSCLLVPHPNYWIWIIVCRRFSHIPSLPSLSSLFLHLCLSVSPIFINAALWFLLPFYLDPYSSLLSNVVCDFVSC